MNTEKIEKLKKGLTNSQIPESLREKIRQQISRLEAEDNASKPTQKEEAPAPKVAKAPTVRKPREKKVVAPKISTVGKTTAMSLAKEIRKDGESWNEAIKRAGTQIKKGTTEVKKTTKTEMQKLLALVKRRKDLKELAGKTNISRDAVRKALPSGKRTSDNGHVYYENRPEHSDSIKIGKYSLENGGGVGYPFYDTFASVKNGFDLYKVNGNENEDVFIGNYETIKQAKEVAEKLGLQKRPMWLRYANGGGVDEKSSFKYYKVPNEQLWAVQECDSDGENCMVIRNKKNEKDAIEEVAKLNKKGYSDYGYADGGSLDDVNFSKFVNAQINYIISLKSVAQKKQIIKFFILNIDDYKGSDVLKRITVDNLKYALQQTTPSKINQVLRTSLNALKFELGGNIQTDLAGHSGGSLGTGDLSLLDGFSNTHNTGQVGETGAMSSGEMFANGGGVWSKEQKLAVEKLDAEFEKAIEKEGIDPYSKEASNLWRSGGFQKKMRKIFNREYELGGGVYAPKTMIFDSEEKPKIGDVLEHHYNKYKITSYEEKSRPEYTAVAERIGKSEYAEIGGNVPPKIMKFSSDTNKGIGELLEYDFYTYKIKSFIEKSKPKYIATAKLVSKSNYELGGGLPSGVEQHYVNYYLGEGASQGIYEDGGSIPNNYEGRTPKDIWDNLTLSQKKHFLSDHSSVIKYVKRNYKGIKDYNLITDEIKHQNNDWNNLDSDIKLIFKEHVQEGQYAKGGGLGKAHYISNRDISGLTTKTGQRLKGSDLLDGAYTNKNIKTPKMSRTQFEDDMYEFADGGSIDDVNFSKFINSQINHIISLKSVAQKKEPIRNLISNMDDYKGSDMLKRITTDNLKYALQQTTPSKINQVLRTSLNALDFGNEALSRSEYEQLLRKYDKLGALLEDADTQKEKDKLSKEMSQIESQIHKYERGYANGGGFEKPFNVLYKTKSGRTMVASRIMAKTEDEAKQKLIKQMGASDTFDKVLLVHESFEDGGKLESGSINALGDLWFAVQQKDTDDYKMLSNNLDKLKVPFVIQNEVSEDAETQRGRKALNIPEVHDRIKKIVKKNSRRFDKGGDLGIEENIGKEVKWEEASGKKREGVIDGVDSDGNYIIVTEYSGPSILSPDEVKISSKNKFWLFSEGGDLGIEEEIDLTDDKRIRVKELTYEYKKPTAKELSEKHNAGAYEFMEQDKMMSGGKTTFQDKSNAIAKRFEEKRVEPKYQKEYGKVYSKDEAKEVGNKITGSMVSKEKMMVGGKTKKGNGGAMLLAKKIRKDGESWNDAVKRAWAQLK